MKFNLKDIINGVAVPLMRDERRHGISVLVKIWPVIGDDKNKWNEIQYSILVFPSGIRPIVGFNEIEGTYSALNYEEVSVISRKAREASSNANNNFLDENYLDFVLNKYEDRGIDYSGNPLVIRIDKYYNLSNHKWKTRKAACAESEVLDPTRQSEMFAYALKEDTKLFMHDDSWVPSELWLGPTWERLLDSMPNRLFDNDKEFQALNLEYLRWVISSDECI